MILPNHQSENHCAKILPQQLYHPCLPLHTSHFNEVLWNEVLKIIKNSLTKSCLSGPVPTFLLKDCVDILLLSIAKLIFLSLADGVFPQKFKKAVATPLIKKALLPGEDLKHYHPGSCETTHATYQQSTKTAIADFQK